MSTSTLELTETLRDYLLSISLREPPILTRLREETANHPLARCQIAPEQGQLMALLLRLIGARKTIEVGVFTGYSSLITALALPDDGKVVACDISQEHTAMARRYWDEAGVSHKIDLRIGPALETLDEMMAAQEQGSYDFAFIDADKESYAAYFERLLMLLRPGGLITVDNVLWSGRVVDPQENDSETEAIRRFNAALHRDPRVEVSVIPIGDGLTLAMKTR